MSLSNTLLRRSFARCAPIISHQNCPISLALSNPGTRYPKNLAAGPSGIQKRNYYLYSPEPVHPVYGHQPVWMSVEQAVEKYIEDNQRIFVHGTAATPTPLLDAITDYAVESGKRGIRLYHLHLYGDMKWLEDGFDSGIIRSCGFHLDPKVRKAVAEGRADHISVFLSEIHLVFRRKIVDLDLSIVHVSPPDDQGYCSLGVSVDIARQALLNSRKILAVCNPQMPRVLGDAVVHSSHFDAMIYYDMPLHEATFPVKNQEERRIGELVAMNLIEDGSTLQLGIGSLPQAIAPLLTGHKDLGIHTEQMTDSVIDLIESGVVTNSRKKVYPGKVVASFAIGTRRLYSYMDDNPYFLMCDASFTNDIWVIRQNPSVVSVNAAIEVDITGQVSADSIGTRFYSGFGGQIDFVRGAALCSDGHGKPIITMTSRAHNGQSKIVSRLKLGAGVVTTRGHVYYIVTEYGIADLHGKNYRQRAYELIKIAHPDDREQLEKDAFERFKVMPSP